MNHKPFHLKYKLPSLCIFSIAVHVDFTIQCASATSVATSSTTFVGVYRPKFWHNVRFRKKPDRPVAQDADAAHAACILPQESWL